MVKFIKIVFTLIIVVASIIFNKTIDAATISVHNHNELVDKLENATENTTIELAADYPEDMDEQVSAYLNHTYDIVIDGKNHKLKSFEDVGHFQIAINDDNSLTIKNLVLLGRSTLDSNDLPILSDARSGSLEVYGSGADSGELLLDNVTFSKINSSFAALFVNYLKNVEINNCNYTYNQGSNLSSMGGNQIGDLVIKNSQFLNNINSNLHGSAYFRGNIRLEHIINSVTVEDSVFDNNRTLSLYGAGRGGGGALGIDISYEKDVGIKVKNNIFKNNNSNYGESQESRGGALGVSGIMENNVLIENNLFHNNVTGSTGSSIILIQETENASQENENTTIRNSTFSNNKSKGYGVLGVEQAMGGTIHLESDNGIFKPKIYENTIISNKAIVDDEVNDDPDILDRYTAGISSNTYGINRVNPKLKGNIILNNQLESSSGEAMPSNKTNVNLNTVELSNNLGVDNGSNIDESHTLKNIFGTTSPLLKSNDGQVAGLSNNKKSIDSYMIIPKTNTMGLADNTSINLVVTDQREKIRSTSKPDIGAVEIGNLKYDANGGNWNLPAITGNNINPFYEKSNPQEIYYANNLNENASVINDDKLSNKNKVFLGWSSSKNATVADYNPNDSIKVSENTVLYAVWKVKEVIEKKVVLTFDKNSLNAIDGKFTNAKVTMKKSLKDMGLSFPIPKRKGYKLIGWSRRSHGKSDFFITTKITSNMKVYAVWEKEDVDIKAPTKIPKTGQSNLLVILVIIAGATLFVAYKLRVKYIKDII